MKVYIVMQMGHYDYKRAETTTEVVAIYRECEPAYKLAHEEQLEYMRDRYCFKVEDEEDDDDEENSSLSKTKYTRDEKDESWKVSYEKLIRIYDSCLGEPMYTLMASQTRYVVVEHPVL
ncbi:hypothetical protein BGZ83_006115 [Gryganskiella cystojenkinii]|nr:hypothetical protein BGZ83_006115 [Gryganskiella cystojenkinii]